MYLLNVVCYENWTSSCQWNVDNTLLLFIKYTNSNYKCTEMVNWVKLSLNAPSILLAGTVIFYVNFLRSSVPLLATSSVKCCKKWQNQGSFVLPCFVWCFLSCIFLCIGPVSYNRYHHCFCMICFQCLPRYRRLLLAPLQNIWDVWVFLDFVFGDKRFFALFALAECVTLAIGCWLTTRF